MATKKKILLRNAPYTLLGWRNYMQNITFFLHAEHVVFVRPLQVVSSSIVDKYIGESARLIREMFNYARDHQPCIIFMDEIDAIGEWSNAMQCGTLFRISVCSCGCSLMWRRQPSGTQIRSPPKNVFAYYRWSAFLWGNISWQRDPEDLDGGNWVSAVRHCSSTSSVEGQ